MKIIYHLSNRQKKELLVRGVTLQIALPAPPIEVEDAVEWAKTMLPAELRPLVRHAELTEVRVSPGGSDGLSGRIGTIVEDGSRHWTYPVVVILVRLAGESVRHAPSRIQWPCDVVIDGKSLVDGEIQE